MHIFLEIFCFSLVAERHVVLGFILICFAVSFFPLMAYRHLIRRICFILLREFILTHALHRRTVCCSCILNASCFRKSLVVYAHRARPRLPSCKGLRSKECPMCRTKMAISHRRATTVREASNVQYADQNGVPPLLNNNSPQSKQHPVRRAKRRSATAGQQQTAKQITSSAQNQMAICPRRTTRDREANNLQCAE